MLMNIYLTGLTIDPRKGVAGRAPTIRKGVAGRAPTIRKGGHGVADATFNRYHLSKLNCSMSTVSRLR